MFLQAPPTAFPEKSTNFSPVNIIVSAFASIVKNNSVLAWHQMTLKDQEALSKIIYAGRDSFQKLVEAAALASQNYRSGGITTRSPSPTKSILSMGISEINILSATKRSIELRK